MKILMSLLALYAMPAFANNGDPFQARCNLSNQACSFSCPQQCESGAVVTHNGAFETSGPNKTKGGVRIEDHVAIGKYLALGADFQTSPGPDLQILLRDSSGKNLDRFVANLDKLGGAQKYQLGEIELDGFDEVVIYCAKFHVDFGVVKLGRN